MEKDLKQSSDDLKALYLSSTDIFSEELLEIDRKLFFENPWHIRIIYGILDDHLIQDSKTGKIVVNHIGKKNRVVVLEIPRNHAKSTAVSVNWVVKKLYENNNLRIVIASDVASQSSSFLREISSHLEKGEKLIQELGCLKPEYPEKWTDDTIIIKRDSKRKDPSVSTVGTGGAILSKRADIIVLDDLINPDNSRTEAGRHKTEFWVNNELLPVREPKTGRLVLIGTAWYEGDYLDKSMKNKKYDVRLSLRAYIKDSQTGEGSSDEYALDIRDIFSDEVIELYNITAKDGVLWPERLDKQDLENERELSGSASFNRQYMNIRSSDDTSPFKRSWIEKAKDSNRRLLNNYAPAVSDVGKILIAQGIDLAVSEKTTADDTVVLTLGYSFDIEKFLLMNIERGKFSPEKTRQTIRGQRERFSPKVQIVESNAYQASMVKDSQKERGGEIVKGFQTTGEKFDEFIGVNSLALLFENNKIILPYDPQDPRTITEVSRLIDEMLAFPSGHTGDSLMALWFAHTGLRQLMSSSFGVRVKSTNIRSHRRG